MCIRDRIYEVDGVKYLMLGGGGAEQDPILPGRTSIKLPAGYPPDLYWKGQPPQEEYNYVLVAVALLGAITHQTLATWAGARERPGSFFGRFRAVQSASFADAVVVMY